MTVQADIETKLSTILSTAITGLVTHEGARSGPELEGHARRSTVRRARGESERLDHGQNEWTETYEIIVLWSPTIPRDDRIAEFAAFEAALLADQYLGGSISGLSDAWLSAFAFGEPIDAAAITCVADVTVLRIE